MFEKFSAANQSVESVEGTEAWRELQKEAPYEAMQLVAERVDESLGGQERLLAIIKLAQALQDENPQRYRFVSEELCRLASFEQVASQQQMLQSKYGNQYTVH